MEAGNEETRFTVRYPHGKNPWLYSGPLFVLFVFLIINTFFSFPYYIVLAVAIVVFPFIIRSTRNLGQRETLVIDDTTIQLGDLSYTSQELTKIRLFPVGGSIYLFYKNHPRRVRAEHIQAVDHKEQLIRSITYWCKVNRVPVESL